MHLVSVELCLCSQGTHLNQKKQEEYVSMLETIGKEHKFDVTFVDLPEKSLTGALS